MNPEQIDLPSPRYILVHMTNATLDVDNLDLRAHAFGPFADYDDLVAFDRLKPRDACYRFAIPLIGPEPVDMSLTALGVLVGARASALPLPPRDAMPDTRARRFVDDAMAEMRRIAKAQKKAAKRAAKEAAEKTEE